MLPLQGAQGTRILNASWGNQKKKKGKERKRQMTSVGTEQDHVVLAPSMAPACLLPVEHFSQRISLVREVRNAETKENSQRRLNHNVVSKHSQGPLVLSQGL